jgi:hypothetical protein
MLRAELKYVCAVCEELLIYLLIHWLVAKVTVIIGDSLYRSDEMESVNILSNQSGKSMYHAPFRMILTEKNGYFPKHD